MVMASCITVENRPERGAGGWESDENNGRMTAQAM